MSAELYGSDEGTPCPDCRLVGWHYDNCPGITRRLADARAQGVREGLERAIVFVENDEDRYDIADRMLDRARDRQNARLTTKSK